MTDHVANLLKDKSIYYIPSGGDYLIKCLNPEHDDSNPSCRVDQITGITHCFSCGFKTNIFKYFGVLTDHTSIKVAKLKEKLRNLRISAEGLELPEFYTPYTQSFRGISKVTLKKFGAFYLSSENKEMPSMADRIMFPITDITGKIILFLGRHTLSSGNPRYLYYPKHVEMPMFPASLEERNSSIVLVEGIFDFLNVYDKGLTNAVCIFGTNTLSKNTAEKMLPFKSQGVTKVYLMLDGDEPGRKASQELKPKLEELELEVEIIFLEDDKDPGELSQEEVSSIKEYINA